MKKLLLGFAALAISLYGSLPSVRASERSLQDCYAGAESNLEMQSCAQDELDSAVAELRAEYKKTEALFGAKTDDAKETLTRLKASEQAWIAYRDSNCQFAGAALLGGSGEGLVILSCQIDMTQKRTAELKRFEAQIRNPGRS